MAISYVVNPTVFGNYRCVTIDVDAGAITSFTMETGLSNVKFAQIAYAESYTSNAVIPKIACNVGSAGTNINGNVFIQSASTGDMYKVFCIGE